MEGTGGSPPLGREGASRAEGCLEGLQGETAPGSSGCTSQEGANTKKEKYHQNSPHIHRILKMEDKMKPKVLTPSGFERSNQTLECPASYEAVPLSSYMQRNRKVRPTHRKTDANEKAGSRNCLGESLTCT